MISHSDITGTDMTLQRVGADNVRAFLPSIGAEHSRIPESTRQSFGHVAGHPDWQTVTGDDSTTLMTAGRSLLPDQPGESLLDRPPSPRHSGDQ